MITISNGIVITQDARRRVIQGNVIVEGDAITSVGKKSERSDIVIDAKGGIVMPGLINMHTHVGMTTLRGAVDCSNLTRFLEETAKFDRRNTREKVKESASMAAAEMIATGTTSFLDLYYSEDAIAEEAERAGIRAFLSWVVLDKEHTTQVGDPIRNAEAFVKKYKNKRTVMPSFGLQGVYACSKDTIQETDRLAEEHGTILHMHLAETKEEVRSHVKKYSMRPVEWMRRNRFLSSRLVAAHAVWVDDKEMSMLARSGTTVVNNAVSNARLGSGTARIKEMLKRGINVALGTDSAASNDSLDMFQTMKFSALINGLTAQEALDAATVSAAKALRCNTGSIEEGKKADIIVIGRRQSICPLSKKNAVSNAVFAAQGSDVAKSIINGAVING